jgi:hypothetical protein
VKNLKLSPIVTFLFALAAVAHAAGDGAVPSAADVHLFDSPKDIKWGPAPPVVPKGAQAAVLDGDPFKDGSSYTLRLKMPDRYKDSASLASHRRERNCIEWDSWRRHGR